MQHLPASRIACFAHFVSKRQLRQRKPNVTDKLRNDLHDAVCFAHANMLTLNRHLFLAHQYNIILIATQKRLTLVAHHLVVGHSFMQS